MVASPSRGDGARSVDVEFRHGDESQICESGLWV